MFERFTESARRALFFARYEVTVLGGRALEPEHLLLGVMRASEPLLANTFALTPAAQADLRTEIARRSTGLPKLPTEAEIPFSPAAKEVLDFAASEAHGLKHAYIGPEHLLLGLLRAESAQTSGDLHSQGISLEVARAQAEPLGSQDGPGQEADAVWYLSSAEESIREAIDRLHAAIRAKDIDTTVAAFDPGAVMFTLAPPLQFRADSSSGRGGIGDWFASFDGPIGYEVRDLDVVAGPEVAFGHALIRIYGRRRDGSETDIWVRETLGLRQVGPDWKIAHQHQSVPFYMDGRNRAAIDLKP
jgi:ketosteroid isomerase-like protein